MSGTVTMNSKEIDGLMTEIKLNRELIKGNVIISDSRASCYEHNNTSSKNFRWKSVDKEDTLADALRKINILTVEEKRLKNRIFDLIEENIKLKKRKNLFKKKS